MRRYVGPIGRKRVHAARCLELCEMREYSGVEVLADGTLRWRARTPQDVVAADMLFNEWLAITRELREHDERRAS